MLSNLDLLNRDLVLLYPRTNVKSIDFAKTIKIFKTRRYINCGKPLLENMVYANQEAYYNAIQHSTATADSGPFIEFMLQEILNTLKRHQGSLISQHNVMEVRDKIRDKFGISSGQIIEQIQRNPAVTLDEIAAALSVTRRSIEKKIKELRDAGYIRREGSNKSGRWIVNDEV